MLYEQTVDSCFAETIGEHGLARASFEATLARTSGALDRIGSWCKDGSLPLLALPHARNDLPALQKVANDYRGRFDDVVVLGTGGSSLGARALHALADVGFGPPAGAPRMHFVDNVDPHTVGALLAAVDPAKTGVLAVSKSGGTAETMAQLMILLPWLERVVGRASLARHVIVVAEPADSPLRRLAGRLRLPALDHDPGLGGRFSVLSLVGLLPALIAGLDAVAVRAGAAEVLDATLSASTPGDAAPAVGAAVSVALAEEKGATIAVVMPYVDRLSTFALWFRQLWAESLGKKGRGTTPVNALGTVDQHSQLQLYLDGPADKFFTIVMGPSAGVGSEIAAGIAGDAALGYLDGRRLGDLMDACQRGTVDTLVASKRPVRTIHLSRVDESALGALMMHYMLETIVAAHLFDVDPFDQPAVEDGKVRARRYLEAMGGAGRA